ncbi:hypothetical protein GT025_18670 [Streptomyces sp. SID4920]|nr:hypothetical protein [Streptomyces sp. SID4920]MYX70771.1 hypothetical protein [Streptomyces sp. SID8373]
MVDGRRQRGGRQERAAVTDRRRAAARVSGTLPSTTAVKTRRNPAGAIPAAC